MLFDIFKQINWVDIFAVIILIRICYISLKGGLPVELFKLFGTITAIYLSLHYYTNLALILGGKFFPKKAPIKLLNFFCFLGLLMFGYLVFVLLRKLFCRFIKMEAVSNLNRWGGLILGVIRGFLLVSLFTFIFMITNLAYLKNSVANSLSGRHIIKVAPNTYLWFWNAVASKFMVKEKFNNAALEAESQLLKK